MQGEDVTDQQSTYRPIEDYGLIGDTHSAALIASNGSIDWCCWPRFDSPAVFCRLLDAQHGGWCRVGPVGQYDTSRSYLGDSNVLATTFRTGTGRCRVTDLMPIRQDAADHRAVDANADHRILRLIEGVSGEVELEIGFRPTFDYARAATTVSPCDGGAVARAGDESLVLACPIPVEADASGVVGGRATVSTGDRFWISLTYRATAEPELPSCQDADADHELARTLDYWRAWLAGCTYDGPYHEQVRRSALVLKLLTFGPSGALIAAPTTSLPEVIGGVRNWDYRYTWLRDSSLILYALHEIGYHQESMNFFRWLENLSTSCRGDLQIMYTIDGGNPLPEQSLDYLEGYRQSHPVRIGNAAVGQRQLDIYGEVLATMDFCQARMGHPIHPDLWEMLRDLADQAAARWQEPDQGIWEVRGRPKHYLFSKLGCWMALDRAIRLARRLGLLADMGGWHREREAIRNAILTEGYDGTVGAFTQVLGEPVLDASALVIPLLGFLPSTDPRVHSTVARIQEQLTAHSLVYRYQTSDGLPGGEAALALCSFWLVDNLALDGRVDEARTLFERVTGYANDLGLLSEQIDPVSGELLGNYPQGYTHLALIRSALNIAKAENRP